MSITLHPTDCSADRTTRWNSGPETRLSRPTTTFFEPPLLDCPGAERGGVLRHDLRRQRLAHPSADAGHSNHQAVVRHSFSVELTET